jgi:hypothetical protein
MTITLDIHLKCHYAYLSEYNKLTGKSQNKFLSIL